MLWMNIKKCIYMEVYKFLPIIYMVWLKALRRRALDHVDNFFTSTWFYMVWLKALRRAALDHVDNFENHVDNFIKYRLSTYPLFGLCPREYLQRHTPCCTRSQHSQHDLNLATYA